jgi:cytochrome c peroxidase
MSGELEGRVGGVVAEVGGGREGGRAWQPWRAVATVSLLVALLAVYEALSLLRPPASAHAARSTSASPARARPPGREASAARDQSAVGKQLFFDTSLSVPAGTSCASCHEPARAFAGNHGSDRGVARGSRPDHFARRNTPSLLYLKFVRRFHFHWEEDASLPDAFGGFFWDGRSDSIAQLAEQPLTNPDEMNAGSRAAVADKLRAAPYAGELRRVFGADALATPERALATFGAALEAYLTSDELAPFTSRYDDFVRGTGTLSAVEQRGLTLFRDPAKGNCGSCHRFNPTSPNVERSLFTDFGYETVAIPRNPNISANDNKDYFDLGLCERHDARTHTDEERFCGSFRTPSLRNVAVRDAYMHNGYFKSLREVVAFYATRSIDSARWYAGGKWDDLPARYHEYVNELSPPYDRGPGERPRLDDGEIDAIVAFLGTLTDAAYRNSFAAAPSLPAPNSLPPTAAAPAPVDRAAAPPRDPSQPQVRHDRRTLANEPELQTQ